MNKQAIFEGRKQFSVFPWSSNGLLAILKNILESEQQTNRNQKFMVHSESKGNNKDRKEIQ
jgi:hypothetical protein